MGEETPGPTRAGRTRARGLKSCRASSSRLVKSLSISEEEERSHLRPQRHPGKGRAELESAFEKDICIPWIQQPVSVALMGGGMMGVSFLEEHTPEGPLA